MRSERRRRRQVQNPKLEMAPMIDVVFLLLVFFVVTIKPVDLLVDLSVARPRPSDQKEPNIPLLRVDVWADGLTVNGRRVSHERFDRVLERIAEHSTSGTVIVTCAKDSRHSDLIRILDTCAKWEMSNIAMMSR